MSWWWVASFFALLPIPCSASFFAHFEKYTLSRLHHQLRKGKGDVRLLRNHIFRQRSWRMRDRRGAVGRRERDGKEKLFLWRTSLWLHLFGKVFTKKAWKRGCESGGSQGATKDWDERKAAPAFIPIQWTLSVRIQINDSRIKSNYLIF